MSDFYTIKERYPKQGVLEIYPEFRVIRSKDLMVKGREFYAVWDEEIGLWSTDEHRIREMIDRDLNKYRAERGDIPGVNIITKYMIDDSSLMWQRFQKYVSNLPNNFHQLDSQITFANTEVQQKDYISKKLPYALQEGDISAWNELVGTLYFPEEREKIEWAIGAVVSGDSKSIQKFLVFYGDPGYGKGTILDIIKTMFEPYCASFDAGELTGFSNFPLEQFANNPLVAIQFDGDLSHIATNTKLNSLVSHEMMTMKEKYKRAYDFIPQSFLFLASNEPVKITNGKSGIIRRLIDVTPSMQKIPEKRYFQLKKQVTFELGAIAHHCLQVYEDMGKFYYEGYKPVEMMFKTDPFFNFVDYHYLIFSKDDGATLKSAYEMYKEYCEISNIQRMPMYKFREELKNYFNYFEPVARIDGQQVRSWYGGFKREKFDILKKGESNGAGSGASRSDSPHVKSDNDSGGYSDQGDSVDSGRIRKSEGTARETVGAGVSGTGIPGESSRGREGSNGDNQEKEEFNIPEWLLLSATTSLLDKVLSAQPAQYANEDDKPTQKWADVTTKLGDIDTSRVHYVRPPLQHIVIDFDLKDQDGNKSLWLNLIAASDWKPTYAEVSKGGCGLHLHYIWDGDISELANVYDKNIEVKTFRGNSSLRRRVSRCNDIPIAHLSSGLPRKEAKKTVNFDTVRSERSLRDLIERNLRKEIHPGTKPSIDFIEKILSDAYDSGLKFDVSDMRPDIMDFAIHSSHQADYCLTRVAKMKFKSDDISDAIGDYQDDRFVFFDVEVFPNLVLINWKFAGDDVCQRMINPKPHEVEALLKYKLIGFNCRRYDNHILYAIYIGKTIPEIYDISYGIINGSKNCMFGEAYNISYTDVYDFCSKKQSLKKWEIQLGIHHQELGLPWDQPVPESKWLQVAEYCDNDVFATEALFNDRQADWVARQILADIADMTVNDTTNSLTTRIIFGREKNPQSQFNYRFMGNTEDLENMAVDIVPELGLDSVYTWFDSSNRPIFPGYKFDRGISTYRGEEVGEGGYVYAEPGIYKNVALLDIASMHPSSIVAEQLFGEEYTKHFQDILQARIYIKHKEYDKAKTLFGGKLAKYLEDPTQAKALSGALKIAINSVYGLTSAKFDNAFRDKRNIDNIVAKRGALFMVNLKHEVQKRGYTVAHIKTDSIKIPDATPDIIQFVMDYGKLYGYTFEHEATYERICLVNDAVYIARYNDGPHEYEFTNGLSGTSEWTATGAQFIEPYVFKSLFSHEPIRFKDLTQTQNCTTALYLNMNEQLPDISMAEKELTKLMAKYRKICKDHEPDQPYTDEQNKELEHILERRDKLKDEIAKGNNFIFIGKVGLFVPVKPGVGGGLLMREKDGKMYAASGTTGYRWVEAETVHDHLEEVVDMSYFTELDDAAIDAINKYGDFYDFVDLSGCSNRGLPWMHEPTCGEDSYENCLDCPHWRINLDQENYEEMFQCDKV